jgi:hypothetical protein
MHPACEKIKELMEDSWKDLMKVYITPTTEHPKIVARTVVDVARTADYMYKETDAFTLSYYKRYHRITLFGANIGLNSKRHIYQLLLYSKNNVYQFSVILNKNRIVEVFSGEEFYQLK